MSGARARLDTHAQLRALSVTLLAVLLAGLLRMALDPIMGNRAPFTTFFIAVVVAVRYGGQWHGLAAAVLGLAWGALLWFPKGLFDVETISSSLLYFFCALAIVALGARMHRAEAAAEAHARDLVDNMRVLSASQGRLQLATEISGTGVFRWDVRRNRFEGENPEAYRIFGRSPKEPKLSMEEFLERHMHPEDSQKVQEQLREAMRPGERFHAEFRNRRGVDGAWRWVEVVGRFLHDEDGTPTQLVGVINDRHHRHELEAQLRRMAADLSDADRRKDEFLATLAHELRNPLAPIRNGIELLKRSTASNAQAQAVVGVMERQMGHMVRLVDDLIDVSRITRNKLELRRHPVEVAALVNAAVEASRPLIDAKGHELVVQLPPRPVHVDADPTRLVQVLANLLNNAARYTERGGHIRIAAERQGQEMLLSVSDDGNGIPPEMLPRVFEMFTQADRSIERSQGGLGIGLSMVKRLVELHDGSVSIHSDGPGSGTRVEVRLPTVLAPMPVAGKAGESPASLPRRRVLVADDNPDAAHSLAEVLQMMGNEVLTVADGLEALESAADFAPDIVMLDLGMPRMNGYEACRCLRGQAAGGNAVIIAVTGWGQEEDRARSREAGFDLHLTKPVDPVAIEALLASLPPPRAR